MRRLMLIAVGAALLRPPVLAQSVTPPEPQVPDKTTTGEIQIGGWHSSLSGSPDVVSRYRPSDLTSGLGLLTLASHPRWGDVKLTLDARDGADQRHTLALDVGRSVRSLTTYSRTYARLGHDPLTNVETATTSGRVLRNTDTDPFRDYNLKDGLLEHRTEIQPRGLGALTVGLSYRDQRRSGHHQTLNVSHCDNCHVYSQSRPIGEKQRDLGLDAKLSWLEGYLRGSYTRRQLRQDTASISLAYDRALQPELRTAIFDNRVQYDSLNGPLPVDVLQDADKNVGRLELHLSKLLGFVLSANGVWSDVRNKYADTRADYQGYGFTAARGFRKNQVRLRLRGRYYTTETGDVFVDTVERPNLAPAAVAGRTYRDIYGLDPDFTRRSSLNRDVYEAGADFTLKLGKRSGNLTGLWSYQGIDRASYEVAPGETRTDTHILGLAWRPRPAKGLRLSADYRHGFVDNPYMLVDGACSDQTTPGPFASPLDPRAGQYYVQRAAQIAETTASPQSWDELRLRASYARSKLIFTGSYRYWNGDNTAGDLSDWSRTRQAMTASLTLLPKPSWDAYLAYTWQRLENANPTCIPIFDG